MSDQRAATILATPGDAPAVTIKNEKSAQTPALQIRSAGVLPHVAVRLPQRQDERGDDSSQS